MLYTCNIGTHTSDEICKHNTYCTSYYINNINIIEYCIVHTNTIISCCIIIMFVSSLSVSFSNTSSTTSSSSLLVSLLSLTTSCPSLVLSLPCKQSGAILQWNKVKKHLISEIYTTCTSIQAWAKYDNYKLYTC